MAMHRERFNRQGFTPAWIRHEHHARYEFARQFVKDRSVVDCACGSGAGSVMFAESGAKQVAAFDQAQEVIGEAQQQAKLPNLYFRAGDALKLPLPDNFADVYISLETIEHLTADKNFVAEAARVVKPEGLFICSTPNRTVTNPGRTLEDSPWLKYHVREYSPVEFKGLLNTQFAQVEFYGQNPQNGLKVRLTSFFGAWLPWHGAVRLNQACKLLRLIYGSYARHLVRPLEPGRTYEFLIAVCRQPLKKTT